MAKAGDKQEKLNAEGNKRGLSEGSKSTQFNEGESGNPAGKKKGQRNYSTIYREALNKVAEAKGLTDDDVELALVVKGLERALRGDFKYYQDIQDRIHGKPVQTNLNKDINDAELDEEQMADLDGMLKKFVKKKPKPKKKAKAKTKAKA